MRLGSGAGSASVVEFMASKTKVTRPAGAGSKPGAVNHFLLRRLVHWVRVAHSAWLSFLSFPYFTGNVGCLVSSPQPAIFLTYAFSAPPTAGNETEFRATKPRARMNDDARRQLSTATSLSA